MANKRTQKDFFNDIIALATANNREDIVDFAKSRIEALNKKSGKVSAKRTEEIDAITEQVYDALVAVGKDVTVSELVKSATNEIKDYSGQKVSAYLKKLVDCGRAVKTTDKKVSYFKAVVE